MREYKCILGDYKSSSERIYICGETGLPCDTDGENEKSCKIWKDTPAERRRCIGIVRYG